MNHIREYANFLKEFLRVKRQLKIVIDCSNGTTGPILKELFHESNVKRSLSAGRQELSILLINSRPDGNFPAHGPNPLAAGAASQLKREVKKQKADLGIIFDADGDRVFFVDDRGRMVDAHEIGFALMQIFKPPYVVSAIASWRLKKPNVKGQKSKVFVSPVGHYFFKNLMRRKKVSVGLEHSGHFYFKDFFYCDSGILSAIMMMNFVSGLENGLAEWLDSLPKYNRSGEINFRVADKKRVLAEIEKKYAGKAAKISQLDGLTMEFGDEWWFNVRPSNTENLLRLNIEATDEKVLEKELRNLKKIITATA